MKTVLTVDQAALRAGRHPDTVRRWICAGRLPARTVGTRYVIEPDDLADVLGPHTLPVPDGWTRTVTGEPMPDTVAALRRTRSAR
jgi:excisionase family DNA binding protein